VQYGNNLLSSNKTLYWARKRLFAGRGEAFLKHFYSTFTCVRLIHLLGYIKYNFLIDLRFPFQIQDNTNTVFITEKLMLLRFHEIRCYYKSVFLNVCLEDKFFSLKFKYL
jgi:hypothetical protein